MSERIHPTHIQHADERYFERYGTKLTEEDYEKILTRIKKGEAKLIADQKEKCIYKMQWDNKEIRLVMDPFTDTIITFLPNGRGPKQNKASSSSIRPNQVWKLKEAFVSYPKEIVIVAKESFSDSWCVMRNDKSRKYEKILEESIFKYYRLRKDE